MYLDSLTIEDCEMIRQWRNKDISHLRTPFFLTKEMQIEFYNNVICNRESNCRFWALRKKEGIHAGFLGMIGLVNISNENRSGEISIILHQIVRGKGYGKTAIDLLLKEGFNSLNLENIFGECYENSEYVGFWEKYCKAKKVEVYPLPRRKYYNGQYYDSIYFNFTKEDL